MKQTDFTTGDNRCLIIQWLDGSEMNPRGVEVYFQESVNMWMSSVPSVRSTWLVVVLVGVGGGGLCLGAEWWWRCGRGHPCLTRQSRWRTAVIWQEVGNRAWPPVCAPPPTPTPPDPSSLLADPDGNRPSLGFSQEELISFPQWWRRWDKAPEMKCSSPGRLRSPPLLYIGLIFYLQGWDSSFFKNLKFSDLAVKMLFFAQINSTRPRCCLQPN